MKKITGYFTKFEIALWSSSVMIILISFVWFRSGGVLSANASIIGVTSLIFSAKGNPIGQLLMIVFSVLYGVISFSSAYYGEMITYLGMTAPMALFALISWLKNPFSEDRSEVKVNDITLKETVFMCARTAVVTAVFYYILKVMNTANLVWSTLSVTTSFFAVYLTFRRSPFFALAYAANDAVLIIMWILAAVKNISYLSVIVCFFIFLVNDLYGFNSWIKMRKRQRKLSC